MPPAAKHNRTLAPTASTTANITGRWHPPTSLSQRILFWWMLWWWMLCWRMLPAKEVVATEVILADVILTDVAPARNSTPSPAELAHNGACPQPSLPTTTLPTTELAHSRSCPQRSLPTAWPRSTFICLGSKPCLLPCPAKLGLIFLIPFHNNLAQLGGIV